MIIVARRRRAEHQTLESARPVTREDLNQRRVGVVARASPQRGFGSERELRHPPRVRTERSVDGRQPRGDVRVRVRENHAQCAPFEAPIVQPRRSRVLEELALRLGPPGSILDRGQRHCHDDIDPGSHAPRSPPSRPSSDPPPPSDVGSLNVQSATPDLAMEEDLYSSVEVTYQTCTCSAPAQARSPVARSERRSMRRATRTLLCLTSSERSTVLA